MKEKNKYPNKEVQLLSILPAESHHQIHLPAGYQKARELCKKVKNGRSLS